MSQDRCASVASAWSRDTTWLIVVSCPQPSEDPPSNPPTATYHWSAMPPLPLIPVALALRCFICAHCFLEVCVRLDMGNIYLFHPIVHILAQSIISEFQIILTVSRVFTLLSPCMRRYSSRRSARPSSFAQLSYRAPLLRLHRNLNPRLNKPHPLDPETTSWAV